jgi:hypothetical protein
VNKEKKRESRKRRRNTFTIYSSDSIAYQRREDEGWQWRVGSGRTPPQLNHTSFSVWRDACPLKIRWADIDGVCGNFLVIC